jgi:hypothetical protein
MLSGFPPRADIDRPDRNDRKVPEPDIRQGKAPLGSGQARPPTSPEHALDTELPVTPRHGRRERRKKSK